MPEDRIRLQKALAQAGVASRRVAETYISEGRVTVNGEVAILGARVDPSSDLVELDGRRIRTSETDTYIMLNKPRGVITTSADTHGRRTVLDIVKTDIRVFPVGRLDADSEGLLLMTNDGALTHALTHPSHGVTKVYVCDVSGCGKEAVMSLLAGADIGEDRPAIADQVSIIDSHGGTLIVEVAIHEGRKRVIRRMFEAVGGEVDRLVRTAIGPLKMGRLASGDYRNLNWEEVASLYEAAGI